MGNFKFKEHFMRRFHFNNGLGLNVANKRTTNCIIQTFAKCRIMESYLYLFRENLGHYTHTGVLLNCAHFSTELLMANLICWLQEERKRKAWLYEVKACQLKISDITGSDWQTRENFRYPTRRGLTSRDFFQVTGLQLFVEWDNLQINRINLGLPSKTY